MRHHPKCDFLDIEGAKCDCGADNKCEHCGADFNYTPKVGHECNSQVLIRRLAEAQAANLKWERSFAGHVYVPNTEYSALCRRAEAAEATIERMRPVVEDCVVALRIIAIGKNHENHGKDDACVERLSKLATETLARIRDYEAKEPKCP